MYGRTTPEPEVVIRSAVSRSCSTKLRSAGAAAKLRLMRSNASRRACAPLPASLGAGLVEDRLDRADDDLPDQPVPRPEPAVDRRAPEPELGRERLDVDPLSAQVAVERRPRARPRGSPRPVGRASQQSGPPHSRASEHSATSEHRPRFVLKHLHRSVIIALEEAQRCEREVPCTIAGLGRSRRRASRHIPSTDHVWRSAGADGTLAHDRQAGHGGYEGGVGAKAHRECGRLDRCACVHGLGRHRWLRSRHPVSPRRPSPSAGRSRSRGRRRPTRRFPSG